MSETEQVREERRRSLDRGPLKYRIHDLPDCPEENVLASQRLGDTEGHVRLPKLILLVNESAQRKGNAPYL